MAFIQWSSQVLREFKSKHRQVDFIVGEKYNQETKHFNMDETFKWWKHS